MSNEIEKNVDKIIGKVKEVAGQVVNSEELELKGKLQGLKGEAAEVGEKVKEKIAGKANDLIDAIQETKEDSKAN
ncbi:CsbD family protein [Faecalispora jeddahensis]|uniref:CsbD family protein n=1 Tax=Faecalispora jeddahensis TaxID=1414721 RepID=UPI0028A7B4B1|nr:CsbD family protein [Faecalispora jeddahensis]